MKRPSPASMILGLCLTAMAGLLGYQQYQLIQLRSGVDSAAEKTSLARISHRKRCTGPSDARKLLCKERFSA
ncbi:methyl-accepting chemotaxis protein, partial [Pseudomonas aeruginosa]|nr:methyl-accepting chemotaxis protein [Pseudomonas aeruginosa]MCS9698308.1 methyl-accepting chemotaxis protein [Pseudomonas aeruginosa]